MDKKAQLTIIGAAIILLSVVTITYGYFTSGVNNDNPQTATITTGTMELTFADNDTGISKQLTFGESVTKLFTLENTGTVDATVDIYWKDLSNSYLYGSLIYKLEYATSANGTKSIAVNNSPVPTSNTATQVKMATQQTVPVDTTYYYTLTVTLVNSKTTNQTSDINAYFGTGFTIESVQKYPTLAASNTWYKGTTSKNTITTINIVNSADSTIIANASESWNADIKQAGTIKCYITDQTLTISGNGSGGISTNANASYLFSGTSQNLFFSNLTSINGLEILDTSMTTDMSWMFYGMSKIISLNLSNFNTHKVTNMSYMFYQDSALKSLDLSKFITEQVTTVRSMFNTCTALTEVNISNFNTSKVSDMAGLFIRCQNLVEVDISNFDTARVTTMDNMFNNCLSLTKIYASNAFVTTSVTSSTNMFLNCSNLVGENNTTYNANNITHTYAVIDTFSSPGYFTYDDA